MTNCTITLVSDGIFSVIPCWYEETNARGISQRGFDEQNKANVMYSTDYITPNKGNYIIKGEYSEGTVEQLIKQGALKVMSVTMLDFGTFPHYEIGLK